MAATADTKPKRKRTRKPIPPKAPTAAEETVLEVAEVPAETATPALDVIVTPDELAQVATAPQSDEADEPVCVVCGKAPEDHDVDELKSCLAEIVQIKELENPVENAIHAVCLLNRLKYQHGMSQDQADFVVTIGKAKIKTQDPARSICEWLVVNHQ